MKPAIWVLVALTLVGEARAGFLIVGAPAITSWNNDVQTKLTGTGLLSGPIDIFDARVGTPTLSKLQGYDAVLVFSDAGFNNSTTLGNNLADYVDGGGGVVVMTFANASVPLGGRWATQNYDPIEPLSQSQNTPLILGTIYDPMHPVLTNVNSFSGGSSSYHGTGSLNSGAIRIADWSNGRPLIAEFNKFSGSVVSLNFYAPSSDARSDFWNASTDGDILMANALNYTAGNFNVSVVPVPSSIALFGSGAFTFAGYFGLWRRNRHVPV